MKRQRKFAILKNALSSSFKEDIADYEERKSYLAKLNIFSTDHVAKNR